MTPATIKLFLPRGDAKSLRTAEISNWTVKEKHMTSSCRKYCLEVIQLSDKLIQLSNDGNAECNDYRCLVLFGIVLDSAYKLRQEAEKRLQTLKEKTTKHA
jgi:hypothetical protein